MNLYKNIVVYLLVAFFTQQICQAEKSRLYTKNLLLPVDGSDSLKYDWDQETDAWCSHSIKHDSKSNKNNDTWDVTNTDPANKLNRTIDTISNADHPTKAWVTTTFTANSTLKPGTTNKYVVDATMKTQLGVEAKAQAGSLKECTAQAQAEMWAAGMKLGQKNVWVEQLSGVTRITVDNKGQWSAPGPPYAGPMPRTTPADIVHDPVTLSLIEVETGQVYSRELFALNINTQDYGNVAFTFDNDTGGEGVLLSCYADESIQISGNSSSDWLISSYGSFSALLEEGVFSATGVWASLPWQLTYGDSGNVLSAYLASDYLFNELNYQIPETLMREGYTYDLTWDWSESASTEAVDVDVVPEPATMLLLGLGGILIRKFKSKS